jgi:multidrug resistance efflux pump
MRLFPGVLLVWACTLFGQQSPEMVRAQEDMTRLRELVAQGAMAPARLADAEEALGDARDDETLHRTLYGRLTVEELTDEQSREMVEAAERRYSRQKERLEKTRKLVEEGVIARAELAPHEEELEHRRTTLELAEARARLLDELAEMARREEEMEVAEERTLRSPSEGVVVRFDGDGRFTVAQLRAVLNAFEKKFQKPMPISANGPTRFHRALGFDHTGRVDVALNPDQPEGVWLRAYLEANAIPYYAFRNAIRGKATGAHIHIGPGSTRLRAAD